MMLMIYPLRDRAFFSIGSSRGVEEAQEAMEKKPNQQPIK